MSIFEIVATALDTLNVPYAMDTYLGDLPDLYLVYMLISGAAKQHADDEEKERTVRIQVSIYNRGGLLSLPDVDGAMTAAGFTRGGWTSLPYDVDTGHFGMAKDYFMLLSNS